MTDKSTPPSLNAKSFTCPHSNCRALAHQTWFKPFANGYEEDDGPWVPNQRALEDVKSQVRAGTLDQAMLLLIERKASRELFINWHQQAAVAYGEVENLAISSCYSCKQLAVWVADNLNLPFQHHDYRGER